MECSKRHLWQSLSLRSASVRRPRRLFLRSTFSTPFTVNSEDYPEGFAINQEYGDRVTGTPDVNGTTTFHYLFGAEGFTPNVEIGYGPTAIFTGGPTLWRYDYGDLQRVLFQGSTFILA
ncbi:MAG: hypothetical protein ACRD8O_00315, partial [Bryobacteraceae bacterium]